MNINWIKKELKNKEMHWFGKEMYSTLLQAKQEQVDIYSSEWVGWKVPFFGVL